MLPRLLFNCHTLTQRRGMATLQKFSSKKNPGKYRLACSKRVDVYSIQTANFSVSFGSNGIFDFFKKKEVMNSEVVEKVWEFNGPALDSGASISSEGSDGMLKTFEGRSSFIGNNEVDSFGCAATSNTDNLETFADFGLGSGIMPHKIFQDALEYLTTTQGLDWIPAIAVLTVILRILTVPGVIGMRRYSVHSNNVLPETLKHMQNIKNSQEGGNMFEVKKSQMEYMTFMRKNNLSPIRPLLINLPNAIAFASMFYGIRQICTAKVPSLMNGGMLWFTNLSVPDPYFILPVLSCVSMSLIIMSGAADAEMGALAGMDMARKIFMWLPLVSLPFLIFQPAAMFAFWIVSNSFTILLILLLRNCGVKRFCGIPKWIKHDKALSAQMQKAMNPFEAMRSIKKNKLERQNLMKKVQHYQDTIKKMQEMEKRKK